jgi:hypothetical protein
MKLIVKLEKIPFCTLGESRGGWMYEILFLKEKSTYQAEVWGYDDYDDLGKFKSQETSPEFATAEEAEAYAQKEWVIEL